jgi:hypothetical protein
VTEFRDRQDRARRWQQLDEDVSYGAERSTGGRLRDQIRTVLETFRDRLYQRFSPADARCRRRDLRQGRRARRRHRPDGP